MIRHSIFAFALLAAAHSHASFDLMLIGNNSGGDYRVSRWDPINRVSLGSFGSGIITAPVEDVAVVPGSDTAWVISNGAIYKFNYSTGEFQGASGQMYSTVSSNISYDSGGNFFTVGSGQGSGIIGQTVFTQNLTLGPVSFGATYSASAPIRRSGSSNYYAFTLEGVSPYNLSVSTWNSSGTFLTVASTGIAWTNSPYGNGFHDAAFSGTKLYGVQWDSITNNTRLWSSETSSGFAATPVIVTSLHGSNTGNVRRSISAGHNGMLWVRTGNIYSSYLPGLGSGPSYTMSALGTASDLTGMAVVVAPEPASLLALSAALVGLLKRRKSK